MVTVLRAHKFRVIIFLNDHFPAHVHVLGDGEAKINLMGVNGAPMLIWTEGMSRSEVRRAMRLVIEQQDFGHAGRRFMAELSDAQREAAVERGRMARLTEPRALAPAMIARQGA